MLQGFACDADPSVGATARWLRFTPTLSTLCILAGTALRSSVVLWTFAVIAAIGAAGWNVFDLLFNVLVRHLVRSAPLPPNPEVARGNGGAGQGQGDARYQRRMVSGVAMVAILRSAL